MRKLPFTMQTQQQESWCWAAVAASVSQFYDPYSPWRQCDIASHCLRLDCCTGPAPCNFKHKLDHPLILTDNLRGVAQPGNITPIGVQRQIDLGRPVCCHIRWPQGDGHFVVITGYERHTQRLFVDDSRDGPAIFAYQTLLNSYRTAAGTWDYTYYTKPSSITATGSAS